jgi:hypothetical protein
MCSSGPFLDKKYSRQNAYVYGYTKLHEFMHLKRVIPKEHIFVTGFGWQYTVLFLTQTLHF